MVQWVGSPLPEAMKPKEAVPPGGMVLFQETPVKVWELPLLVCWAFHTWATVVPPGRVRTTSHWETVLEVSLRTVTDAE